MGSALKAGWTIAKPWIAKGLKFVGEAAAAAAIEKAGEKINDRAKARKDDTKKQSSKSDTGQNKA